MTKPLFLFNLVPLSDNTTGLCRQIEYDREVNGFQEQVHYGMNAVRESFCLFWGFVNPAGKTLLYLKPRNIFVFN